MYHWFLAIIITIVVSACLAFLFTLIVLFALSFSHKQRMKLMVEEWEESKLRTSKYA